MALALGLKLRIQRMTSALASVITTNLQAWHKFTATAWSGSNRLPDSSPVATNTAALYTGRALDFDGVNDVVTVGATGVTVKTVIFYANPDTTTQSFMQLQSTGAVRIQIASGTLSATGFTSPTLYVNGAAGSSVSASAWQMIAVTSATGVSASNVLFGQQNTTFYSGSLSNVKFFSTELSSAQIAELYANPEQRWPTGSVEADLVGWWPMAEGAGTVALAGAGTVQGNISGATWATAQAGALPQWATGSVSTPIVFDGVNDYITVPDAATLDLASGDNFTITALVYVKTLPSSDPMGIIAKTSSTSASATNWSFAFRKPAGGGNGLLFRRHTATDFKPATDLTSTIEGKVVLLTFRRNGTTADFFVNGTKSTAAASYAGYDLSSTDTLAIGAWDAAGNFPMNGHIFYAAIWNTNLTDQNISDLATFATTPDLVSASNLKGYWRNNGHGTGGWRDLSGNSNHASAYNGSPATALLPLGKTTGKDIIGLSVAKANTGQLICNGAEYATVADAASLDITTAITIEAWVKPFTVSSAQTIIGKNGSYALGITSAGKPVFTKWTSAASTATATTTTTLTLNTWAHLAATYDGTNVKLYINGVLNTTTAVSGAMDATSAAVLLGALTTSTQLYNGYIDSAKIYDTAFTAAQVATNYAAETADYQ